MNVLALKVSNTFTSGNLSEGLTPELTWREALKEAFDLADDIHAISAHVE